MSRTAWFMPLAMVNVAAEDLQRRGWADLKSNLPECLAIGVEWKVSE